MKIRLSRDQVSEPYKFKCVNERDNSLFFDAKEAIGGGASAFSPMEALAAALAGCSSVDVVMVLRKQQIEPEHYAVYVEAKRKDEVPAIFESLHLIFEFSPEVDPAKAERAIKMSVEKYCSVSKILEPTATITHELRILDR